MIPTPIPFGGRTRQKDYRDVAYGSLGAPIPSVTVPESFFVDLAPLGAFMQNQVGSCGQESFYKYYQVLTKLKTGLVVPFSPRFGYTLSELAIGGNVNNQGTDFTTNAKINSQYGFGTENTLQDQTIDGYDEYVLNLQRQNIPALAFTDAEQYKLGGFAFTALDVESLKKAIVANNGMILLTQVGKEWYTASDGTISWDASKILPVRPPQSVIDSHFYYVFGFEPDSSGKTRFWFLNSWSNSWGEMGKGYWLFEEYQPFIQEGLVITEISESYLAHLHELPPAGTFAHTFSTPISSGQTGDEVKALQTALYIDGELEINPNGFGTYGPLTEQSIIAFQYKYNLIPSATIQEIGGKNVGPITLAKLNTLFARS